MTNNEQYSPVQTQFNTAMGTTFRINNLFQTCDTAALTDNLPLWLRGIECLYRIVDSKLKDTERKAIELVRHTAVTKLHYLSNAMQREPGNETLDDPLTPAYDALDAYQKVVAYYMDVHGMLMTNKADPGLAFRGDM